MNANQEIEKNIKYNGELQMKSWWVTLKLMALLSLSRTWQRFHPCTLEPV